MLVSLLSLPLKEIDHHHRNRFDSVTRHISPHILRELEGLAPDNSRAEHLPSVRPPPSFRVSTRVQFRVYFFRPQMLGVSLAPTSPLGSYNQTSQQYLRTPRLNQRPARPPRPRPSNLGDFDSIFIRPLSHSFSLSLFMVIYFLRPSNFRFLSLYYFQRFRHFLGVAIALPHCSHTCCSSQSHYIHRIIYLEK
jgi:hypothetical protein